jgi:hypothetical protein
MCGFAVKWEPRLPGLAPQVELILSVAALTKGLYVVVAMSLIGSILSNLLLVMGAAPRLIWLHCCALSTLKTCHCLVSSLACMSEGWASGVGTLLLLAAAFLLTRVPGKWTHRREMSWLIRVQPQKIPLSHA